MPVSTRAMRLAALEALKAVGEPLAAASLFLFTNLVTVDENLVMGDLVEATFNGYAREAGLVFGTPFVDVEGNEVMGAPSVDFIATDGVIQETVFGWGLCNVGATVLHYAELLETPVPIEAASDGLNVDPVIPFGA